LLYLLCIQKIKKASKLLSYQDSHEANNRKSIYIETTQNDVRWHVCQQRCELAIAVCLAMVGLAVMPAVQPLAWYFTLAYHPEDVAISTASTAYEALIITATVGALIATGGIGFAGALALGIMVTPTVLE